MSSSDITIPSRIEGGFDSPWPPSGQGGTHEEHQGRSASLEKCGKSSQRQRAKSKSRGLENIDPKFVSESGLCSSSEVETSRGFVKIQHLTGGASNSMLGI